MPSIAYLECSRCHHHVSADAPQTLCPICAGSLYVRYDMDKLKQTAKREDIAAKAAASPASLGMWRYSSVLPDVTPVTLGEGWTPMLHSKRYPGLYIKEEGANPPAPSRLAASASPSPWPNTTASSTSPSPPPETPPERSLPTPPPVG